MEGKQIGILVDCLQYFLLFIHLSSLESEVAIKVNNKVSCNNKNFIVSHYSRLPKTCSLFVLHTYIPLQIAVPSSCGNWMNSMEYHMYLSVRRCSMYSEYSGVQEHYHAPYHGKCSDVQVFLRNEKSFLLIDSDHYFSVNISRSYTEYSEYFFVTPHYL